MTPPQDTAATKRLDERVRSERHFTSGLLLHLLLHDGLRGVDAFFDLLVARGILAARPLASAAADPRTQVIAELAVHRDLIALHGAPEEALPRDVIDVVVVAGEVLVAVEAKFFTRPTAAEVRDQLEAQRGALAAVLRDPAYGVSRVVQVFLEHGRALDAADLGCAGVLAWGDIHGLARGVLGDDAYVTRQLAGACVRCDAELRPSAPGVRRWEAVLDYDRVVALCTQEGDHVVVGYEGGERALRLDTSERLRRRRWKWDRVDSARNALKDGANWIPGARFLALVAALEASGR